MSKKGKYSGLTQKKRDERVAKKKTGIDAMISGIAGQTQKFINEWSEKFNGLGKLVHEWGEKHNQLGAIVDSVFKIATTEVGKLWGNQQRIVESIDHIDINTLAVAELHKDVYKRFSYIEPLIAKLVAMAELVPDSIDPNAPHPGEALYKEASKAAFAIVLERRQKEDEERKAAAEKAAADAKAAEEAKTEAERAEKALKEAETETLTDATAGGKGAEIPEGAQVFGG